VYIVGKSIVLMVLQGERDLYCMYSNRFLESFLEHTSDSRVASVTVTLETRFDRRWNTYNNLERDFVEHLTDPGI